MNTRIAILALAPSLLSAGPADNYVNFIRQIQDGVERDVTVASQGSRLSERGVSLEGALFQLWSVHNTTASQYKLDEQFVSSFSPNASIEILSADPYGPVPRTRVDQPFQVRVSVTGLLTPSDPAYLLAPDAAKWVDYSHVVFAYPEGDHSLENVPDPVGELIQEGYMEENANARITFGATNLSGPDLTTVEGEEVFTIHAQASFGMAASVLDSKKIQIWPIARGVLSGVDPTAVYEAVPPMTIRLTDLYPKSATYLRVYPEGTTADSAHARTIVDSCVIIEDPIPRNAELVLHDTDDYFPSEGRHILELVHETPFGTDILYTGTIQVDRTIEVVGSLNTH